MHFNVLNSPDIRIEKQLRKLDKASGKQKKQPLSEKLVFFALFTAFAAVANMIDIQTPVFSISLVSTVCFLAGAMLGVLGGMTVGGIGDLLGCLQKGYVPNPIILIGSMLLGAIPGIIFHCYKRNKNNSKAYMPAVLTVITFVLTFIVCTMGVNSFGTWWFYMRGGKAYGAWLITRLSTQPFVTLANAVVSALVITIVYRIPYFKKFFKINNVEHSEQ